MPYTLDWYNDEHTAILRVLKPGWTWDEFEESYLKAFEIMKTVKHKVHLIGDYTLAPQGPHDTQGTTISHFGTVWSQRPPNLGLFIIVGEEEFLRTMGQVFVKSFAGGGDVARYVRTREEVDALLAELPGSE